MEMVPLGLWNTTNILNIYIFSNKTELKVQYGGLEKKKKKFNFFNLK